MPQFSKSPNGCETFYCQFEQGGQLQGQLFKKYDQCPSREQIDTTLKSCESSGLKGVVRQENGCGVASCIQQQQNTCPGTQESRARAENECSSGGLNIMKSAIYDSCRISLRSIRPTLETGLNDELLGNISFSPTYGNSNCLISSRQLACSASLVKRCRRAAHWRSSLARNLGECSA